MSEPIVAPAPRSPLLSIWWAPRRAADDIVAARPGAWLVLLLAVFGGMAGAVNLLSGVVGTGGGLIDGRLLLGALLVGGSLFGLVTLYVSAYLLSRVGRGLGGEVSAATMRAVLAFAMLPSILGLLLSLLVAWLVPSVSSAVLQLISGVCTLWAIIVALLMLARAARFGVGKTLLAYAVATWLIPVLAASLIRSFLFQPFSIPSGSDVPTLLVGDYVFATKYAYGYTRFSIPFSPPIFSGRLLARDPARGDVVVFRLPDGQTDYVKRIVGLPGDRVQMKDGQLFINDAPVARERIDDLVDADACGTESVGRVKRWRETLPNGVSYDTLDCVDGGYYDTTNPYRVPPGHVFTIGDNRDNSTDSRMLTAVGYIPFENLIGRVGMIFFSREAGAPGHVRFERIGTVVR
ncbi:signal peptidase I [Bradyrhizobium sp. HKCCYLS2038]|uniref:signal peptidase I n=1 Tax=unclassified Bradyrhizobium TaxID=2631580 RepID=UPI003EC14E82